MCLFSNDRLLIVYVHGVSDALFRRQLVFTCTIHSKLINPEYYFFQNLTTYKSILIHRLSLSCSDSLHYIYLLGNSSIQTIIIPTSVTPPFERLLFLPRLFRLFLMLSKPLGTGYTVRNLSLAEYRFNSFSNL